MEILWNDLTVSEWDAFLSQAPKSNLLQSWPYAQTMRAVKQMNTRFGRLVDGEETLAIFQVQEVKIPLLYHAVSLDRGPIWLIESPDAVQWRGFLELLLQEFPKRFGGKRRIMPELSDPITGAFWEEQGLVRNADGYRSIWIDLGHSEEELRSRMKQKWRNAANQAERKNVEIVPRKDRATFDWLMERYVEDRRLRKYSGPSVAILRSLFENCQPRGEELMFVAKKGDADVAAILLFLHGRSATYQVGWTSEAGRDARAHQLLLWRAMQNLKEDGFKFLDLGGIEPDHAEGVTQFKRGVGGDEFQLVGVYG